MIPTSLSTRIEKLIYINAPNAREVQVYRYDLSAEHTTVIERWGLSAFFVASVCSWLAAACSSESMALALLQLVVC